MRCTLTALIGAAALTAVAPAAVAQTAVDKADARCILVLTVAASQNEKIKDTAVRGTFFYLGRLSARGASAKLGPVMVAEAKTINSPQMANGELKRCITELDGRAGDLRAGMAQMQAAAKAERAAMPAGAPPPPKK
jgi:hypothetical protein